MNLKVTDEELKEWDNSPLLQFLEEKREVGEFESTSSFSVNLEAAQSKLGRFTLPRPTAWILKFVQCANELGCENIRITMGKEEIEVVLGRPGDFELRDISDGLTGLTPKNPTEEHLFTGLIALRNMPGAVLLQDSKRSWNLKADSEVQKSEYSGDYGLKMSYHPEPLGFFEKLRRRLTQTIGILDELQTWCYASAVPVLVDGAPLQPAQPFIPLLNGLLTDDPRTRVRVGSSVQSGEYDRKKIFSSWASSKSSKFSYAVRIEHRPSVPEPSICLDWIRSGVIIKREAKNVRACKTALIRTLVPTNGLRFDLTGFDFEETDTSRHRRRRGAFYTWHGLQALQTRMALRRRWENFLMEQYPEHNFTPRSQAELLEEIAHLIGELKSPRHDVS